MAAPVHLLLADIYVFRGDWTSGERNLNTALHHWATAKNEFGIAQTEISLSWLYSMTGKWEQGLKLCHEAYEFFSKHQDTYHIGLTYLNTAEIFRLHGRIALAIEWNQKAISSITEIGSKLYEGIATIQLGYAYLDNSEVQKAIETLEHALKLEEEVGEQYYIGLILLHLALAHQRSENLKQAQQYFEKSEAKLASAHNRFGFALLHLEYCRQALRTSNYDRFHSSLAIADKIANDLNYVDIMVTISILKGLYQLQLHVSQSAEEREPTILKTAAKDFSKALMTSVRYNRYLLDRTIQAIGESIIRYTGDSCRNDGIWLLDQLIDFWRSEKIESGDSLTDLEVKARSLEAGDGQPQVDLLTQIRAIRSILGKER
jgi:tetratricopeptide (TPR) repeat protein